MSEVSVTKGDLRTDADRDPAGGFRNHGAIADRHQSWQKTNITVVLSTNAGWKGDKT